jgi:C_GCAxxG_C_C family probable redox protein
MNSPEDYTDIAAKAAKLGHEYERTYYGCAQCIIGAVLDTLGIERNELFKAATGLAGGVSMMGDGSCGAYLGGVMLIGDRTGRSKSNFSDAARVRYRTYMLAKEYHQRFIDCYGSVTCRDLHMKLFGRPYYLLDKDEFAKFDEAGGHVEKCPNVVGTAAGWLIELLGKENLLQEWR